MEVIERLRREFLTAMFLLGVDRAERLVGNERLIAGAGQAVEEQVDP